MLRMISFNMEFNNQMNFEKNQSELNSNKFQNYSISMSNHCKDCEEYKYCLKFLENVKLCLQDYNLINYLAYIFYPPVYFSGPTILFNSFIFQIKNSQVSKHQEFFTREKMIYIMRYIFVFISFELFNHSIYVNAYLTLYQNKFIWQNFDYYAYSVFCFFLLIFIWFKFTVIWRTTRLWAWLDGVYTEENMNRCMYNNYCFEGFWRAWHKSFNSWLVRYIFIPLGGSKYKVFIIWVVFSFVALWHDLKLNLLIWAWFICLFFMPEILVKNYFGQPKVII
jgi:D-alanyl-lipoteichoic acid acyltransferase DltB (MBOAT superfamily)